MKQRIRLQKALAQAGVASRRHAEKMIAEGRVRVNGELITSMGAQVDPHQDRIDVDNKPLTLTYGTPSSLTLLLHKPAGVLCTASDPGGRKTVFDLLDAGLPRLFTVGRLDYSTEGALLLTNDGQLANAMMHPKFKIPKVYEVRIKGRLEPHHIAAIQNGIVIDGVPTQPVQITEIETHGRNGWYRVILLEGRNRQIRKMMEKLGFLVARLRRTTIGGLELGDLRSGAYRIVTLGEVQELLRISSGPEPLRSVSKLPKTDKVVGDLEDRPKTNVIDRKYRERSSPKHR